MVENQTGWESPWISASIMGLCRLDGTLIVSFDNSLFFLLFSCIVEKSSQPDNFTCGCTQCLVLSFT